MATTRSRTTADDTPATGSMSRRILDEAARLFYEDGFPATSVRKITAACGVTAGSLYNHYGSKEEVLYAILRRAHEDSERMLEEGLLRGGDRADGQLAELVRELTLFHTERRIEGLVARTEWRHLPPGQAREVLDAQRRVRRIFERTLERGLAAGRFRLSDPRSPRPVQVDVVAKAILDMCINAGQWFRPEGAMSAQDLADQYAFLALQLVGAGSQDT
ncbi:TetR/AcrR family transcriptional regulator [Actinomadura luteofluorescens]|uniref:AcrR family transcriptional regulator n=1 Tax=Actinomadura luteofluorescens TaxID=46163 RepID=A0A7Y9EB78_9ACTN|nr:TetR/AcrR family transcriptional regulator [Actinomadura luteofluorescens]NYD44595.1 AcrR family transcriptional regulator [Actinomadura luteofluorescens]